MNPIDLLSQDEIQDIKTYMSSINHNLPVCDTILDEWNKNKRTLVKALGGNLKVKIPYELPLRQAETQAAYSTVYHSPYIASWETYDALVAEYGDFEKARRVIGNSYVSSMFYSFVKHVNDYHNSHGLADYADGSEEIRNLKDDIWMFSQLFTYDAIQNGTPQLALDYQFHTINYTLRSNVKTMRAIRKIMTLIHFSDMDAYESWRNQISDIHTKLHSHGGNLVFSIHPLDYLTISDNACGWRSCMANIEEGCYSNGTIELLNSNNIIVTYIESNTPFEHAGVVIPNKRWRQLLVVHRDCIITGKSYPYQQDTISRDILCKMEKMVSQNLNWHYDYHCQSYHDLLPWYDLGDIDLKYDNKKSIYIKTNGFYHDMIQDKDTTYYISRRRIKRSKKINISGKCTCLVCGDSIWDEGEMHSGSGRKMCHKCGSKHWCGVCHKYHPVIYSVTATYGIINVCENCLKNKYLYSEQQGAFVPLEAHTNYIDIINDDYERFNIYEDTATGYSSDRVCNPRQVSLYDYLNYNPLMINDDVIKVLEEETDLICRTE